MIRVRHFVMLVLLVTCLPALVQAQPVQRCFPVWQGFYQAWGYNHRLARMGDYIKTVSVADSCSIRSLHAAASGSGSDRADFTQYYTTVQSTLVESYEGVAELSFTGREGVLLRDSLLLSVELPSVGDSAANYEVVLNGWDLQTAAGVKADKPIGLDIAIDSVWRDMGSRKVWFRLKSALLFGCSTGECEPLNQVVDYSLEVHYLVLGGHGFASKRSSLGAGRNWEKDAEAGPPLQDRVALIGDGRYATATVGITGIHLLLSDEQHMLRWDTHLHTRSYADGLLMVDVGLGFAQNGPKMRDAYKLRYEGKPKWPAGWVLKHSDGSAAWELNVSLLQFDEATLVPGEFQGHIDWHSRPSEQAEPGAAAESAQIHKH